MNVSDDLTNTYSETNQNGRRAPAGRRRSWLTPSTPPTSPTADEILSLIEEREKTARECGRLRDWRSIARAEAASLALAEARHVAAIEFGRLRDWRPRAPFELRRLSRQCRVAGTPYPHFDHPWWFRLGRRPVALVAQPYKENLASEKFLREADEIAREHGLRFTVADATGEQSWYFPRRCAVIVWEAA